MSGLLFRENALVVDERDRVAWLRALAARLEQLPRSEARDELLRKVRSRFVAVETEPRKRVNLRPLRDRDRLERSFYGE